MDTAGIRMQVLSVPGPGAEIVSDPDGIAIAREYNDRMARLISAEPERFAAFAHPSTQRLSIHLGFRGSRVRWNAKCTYQEWR